MAASAAGTFLHNAAGALWTTQAKATAEATAATGTGAGLFLWNWNRAYYQFDVKQRWSRFNFMNKMACSQTGQYREDIEDLATQTSSRMDNFHILGVMALTIVTALFCPGRVGLHTPPPPSWLMGLFQTNLAGAYLWLGLTMWLAMHASLKADSAAVHMLTRYVRMPVPSQKALDRARKIFSSWEYQDIGDMFRVPFFMKHRHASQGVKEKSKTDPQDDNVDFNGDADAMSRTRHQYDVPSWFKAEREIDEGRTFESLMPLSHQGDKSVPEHFERFRVIQCQYWPYDIYARICVFLSWMHIMSAWAYYQCGHTIMETRAMWAALTVVIPLHVTQQILITLDIAPTSGDFFPWVRLGPCAMFTGYIGAVLEYKRWYSEGGLYASVFFGFVSYLFTILYTVHLLKVCAPSQDAPEASEAQVGAAWWPSQWRLPAAWTHAVWLVAPPKSLGAGEYDLVGELRELSKKQNPANSGIKSAEVDPTMDEFDQAKQRDIHNALQSHNESPAWFFVKVGLSSMLIAWIWLSIGYLIDVVNEGTTHPSLLSAPGLPNHLRDPRYRKPKPGYACIVGPDEMCLGQEVGPGGYYAGPVSEQLHRMIANSAATGHHHRRLMTLDEAQSVLADKIQRVLPYLQHAIHDRDDSNYFPFGFKNPDGGVKPFTTPRANVKWPALFEPRLLACSPDAHEGDFHVAAAISRHGRGMIIKASAEELAHTEPFVLDGAALFAPFRAAHWQKSGLLLSTISGALLECPEQPSAGRWNCNPLRLASLPLGESQPFAGTLAVARHPTKASYLAAVAYPGEPSITLFQNTGIDEHSPWLPVGETRTPSKVAAAAFDHNAEAMLLLLADGAVAQMRLSDGTLAIAASAVEGPAHTWQSTCSLASSKVARLGVRPSGQASWEPSLIFGA